MTEALLIAIAIFSIITIRKFVGYAGVQVPAEAGTITTILIDHRQPTSHWHGLYGLVFTEAGWGEEQSVIMDPGELSAQTFVFDCVDKSASSAEITTMSYWASLGPSPKNISVAPPRSIAFSFVIVT